MIWLPLCLEFRMDARIVVLAIIGLILTAVIKQWKADFLPLVRLAVTAVFTLCALSVATPFISFVKDLMPESVVVWAKPLLKALGIAVLTQISSDLCRECGEASIASSVEMIGKIEILLLSIPLIEKIMALAQELISLGSGS